MNAIGYLISHAFCLKKHVVEDKIYMVALALMPFKGEKEPITLTGKD